MNKKHYIILIFSLFSLVSCNSKTGNSVSIPPVALGTVTEKVKPIMPDSIANYQPVLGVAGTIRQFPFGPSNQLFTTLRLAKVTTDGKLTNTYRYDDKGRLIERTDYYTDGIHIYNQFAYSYNTEGIRAVATKLNKEAPNLEGVPQNNDLLPSRTISYSPIDKSIAGIVKTTNTVFIDWYQKPGIVQSHLGFSPTGTLISEERRDEQGKMAVSTVYRRNEVGNVLWLRTRTSSSYWDWDIHYFTYDTNPNPYRTTGDSQLVSMSDLLATNTSNINNVITHQANNSEGGGDGWRYAYDYRPDGYPYRMKAYRSGILTRTLEYSYNQ